MRPVRALHSMLTLTAISVAPACQSYPERHNISAAYAGIPEGRAVLVGSVTQSGTVKADYAEIRYRQADGNVRGRLESQSGFDWVRQIKGPDEITLFALELPAGIYCIEAPIIHRPGSTLKPRDAAVLQVKVLGGTVSYIGNLHMTFTTKRGLFGLALVSGGAPSVSDRYERDLELLEDRFPYLGSQSVVRSALDDSPWRREIDYQQPMGISPSLPGFGFSMGP